MQICCAGEVMVELAAGESAGQYLRGVAGDSYNTAIYLARAGLSVRYLTRLGDDPLSDNIIGRLQAAGIATDLVGRSNGRRPGLYLIDNDADGERHFHYWRGEAPARELFDKPLAIPELDVFYFTGITLAVTRSGLDNLVALLRNLRATGCSVVFDPNYRPALWLDREEARRHYEAILPLCDTLLPTLEDDTALWDIDSVEASHALYARHGAGEIVIKGPQLTAYAYSEEGETQRKAQPVAALDTTGAGDSFNAGYLAARLDGKDMNTALQCAQQLAAQVVQQPGAILPAN